MLTPKEIEKIRTYLELGMKHLSEEEKSKVIESVEQAFVKKQSRFETSLQKINKLKQAREKQREILKPIEDILEKAEIYKNECDEIIAYFRTQRNRGLIQEEDYQKIYEYTYKDKTDLEFEENEIEIIGKKGKIIKTFKIK